MRTPLLFLNLLTAAGLLVSFQASAEIPRPEHPRPDSYRTNWLNLNGEWQFEIDKNADGESRGLVSGKDLNSKIIVPFCAESKLSGIGSGNETVMKNVWYRRSFNLPQAMKGKRVLLHFGGVDYKTWVYINGRFVGSHIGESAEFSFDITPFLKNEANEVVVQVFDDTASGLQPTGKQAHHKSEGCVYTRTTGIWQTVWLEAVGSSYVDNFSIVADPDRSRVVIEASVTGNDPNLKLVAEAFAGNKHVGTATATGPWRGQQLVIRLNKTIRWDTKNPFLYDLKFTLFSGKKKIDEVSGYFGLRKVTIDGRRILINGKPVFQRLILDQGFYPDGIWTAPSDAELKADIQRSMAAGYNGARLHQKVFEPRYLYWADKLGYLVWGEFPNWGYNYKPEGYAPYITEWTEVLLRDRNHPSVIGWCPFNETDGVAGEIQRVIWNITKAIDPTRPVLETSGWSHTLMHPEVLDNHDYDQNPETFRARWMDFFSNSPVTTIPSRYKSGSHKDIGVPFMISEFGGIGWATEGGWGYGSGPKTIEEFYTRYKGLVDAQLDNPNLFGFCYTQLTDVEQEHNGLYYYDRRPKFDMKRLHNITSRQAACERNVPTAPLPTSASDGNVLRVLIGALADGPLAKPFHYTTQAPDATWNRESFDDHDWKTGLAPFGNKVGEPRTEWNTSDIFLRQNFEYDGTEFKSASIVIFHDEDTEVYVNGQKILGLQGFVNEYNMHHITEALRKAIHKGTNTIAVHTHQTGGGQYIDIALLVEY